MPSEEVRVLELNYLALITRTDKAISLVPEIIMD